MMIFASRTGALSWNTWCSFACMPFHPYIMNWSFGGSTGKSGSINMEVKNEDSCGVYNAIDGSIVAAHKIIRVPPSGVLPLPPDDAPGDWLKASMVPP